MSTGDLPGGRAEFCDMRAVGAVWPRGPHFLRVCCCSQASQCLILFRGPSLQHPREVLRGLIRCRAHRPWSRLLSELVRCDGHRAVPEGCASFAETMGSSSVVVTSLSLLWVAALDIAISLSEHPIAETSSSMLACFWQEPRRSRSRPPAEEPVSGCDEDLQVLLGAEGFPPAPAFCGGSLCTLVVLPRSYSP